MIPGLLAHGRQLLLNIGLLFLLLGLFDGGASLLTLGTDGSEFVRLLVFFKRLLGGFLLIDCCQIARVDFAFGRGFEFAVFLLCRIKACQ